MKTCCVCGYWKESGDKENISFHVFPKKENIRQEWIQAIGKENFVPTATSVLCSQHFKNDCFYYPVGGTKQRVYVKSGSIPTIFGTHFTRKSKMLLKQKDDTNDKETQFTNKSFIDTEITSCANDTAMMDNVMDSTYQEAENTYEQYPATPKHKLIRQRNPRYIGDCALSDFQSPRKAMRNWKIALSHIDTLRRKLATIQKQKNRLKKKVTHLGVLIKDLKSKRFLSDDAAGVVSVSNIYE